MRVSAHETLVQELRDLAQQKTWEGGKFLTERHVAEQYKVSRITANKALAALVGEGILEFRRGLGTFVMDGKPAASSFSALLAKHGLEEETLVLAYREVSRTEALDASAKLGVKPSVPMEFAERLRKGNGAALRLERIYLRQGAIPHLDKHNLGFSLVDAAGDEGIELVERSFTVSGHTLDAVESVRLNARTGEGCLMTESVVTDAAGQPLWWARALHHPRAVTIGGGPSMDWRIDLDAVFGSRPTRGK